MPLSLLIIRLRCIVAVAQRQLANGRRIEPREQILRAVFALVVYAQRRSGSRLAFCKNLLQRAEYPLACRITSFRVAQIQVDDEVVSLG